MNKTIAAAIGITALAGCAGKSAMDEVKSACSLKTGGFSASCVSKHPSFASLPKDTQRQITYKVMLSEQVAAKQITQAQADFLQQEYEGKIMAQQNAINEAQAQSASNAMAMAGAALVAADAASRQPAVIYPMPQKMYPTTTTCMGGYRSVTCNNF